MGSASRRPRAPPRRGECPSPQTRRFAEPARRENHLRTDEQHEAGNPTPHFLEQDAAIGHYLAPLLRKWWVVAVVFGLTLLLAAAFSRWSDSTEIYEARTRLLIVVPVSERIIGESGGGPNSVTRLSIDTLSALVAAIFSATMSIRGPRTAARSSMSLRVF